MKITDILLEYDRSKTAQRLGAKLLAAAKADATVSGLGVSKQSTDEELLNAVLGKIEATDPTKNKEYTQGLAQYYAKGGTPIATIGELNDELIAYAKLKQSNKLKPEDKDFLRFGTLDNFAKTVNAYPTDEESQQGKFRKAYDDGTYTVIVPEDLQAAIYWGQGTSWCTARPENSMFDSYNKQGPLYILIPHNPQFEGQKWQIHFPSNQYMDVNDDPIFNNGGELADWFEGLGKGLYDFFNNAAPNGIAGAEEAYNQRGDDEYDEEGNREEAYIELTNNNFVRQQNNVITINMQTEPAPGILIALDNLGAWSADLDVAGAVLPDENTHWEDIKYLIVELTDSEDFNPYLISNWCTVTLLHNDEEADIEPPTQRNSELESVSNQLATDLEKLDLVRTTNGTTITNPAYQKALDKIYAQWGAPSTYAALPAGIDEKDLIKQVFYTVPKELRGDETQQAELNKKLTDTFAKIQDELDTKIRGYNRDQLVDLLKKKSGIDFGINKGLSTESKDLDRIKQLIKYY